MPAKILQMMAVAAICFCDGAFAAAAEQPRHAPASVQGSADSARSADTLTAPGRAKQLVIEIRQECGVHDFELGLSPVFK